jgi:hypothetical protein
MSGNPCRQEFLAGDIAVRIIPHAPLTIGRNAVGSATIADQGVYAVILYDRVRAMQSYGVPAYSVLGKVMAHEITHLLLGADSHAPTGVMRPHWTVSDFRIDSASLWFYTPRQRAALREQFARRVSATNNQRRSE